MNPIKAYFYKKKCEAIKLESEIRKLENDIVIQEYTIQIRINQSKKFTWGDLLLLIIVLIAGYIVYTVQKKRGTTIFNRNA